LKTRVRLTNAVPYTVEKYSRSSYVERSVTFVNISSTGLALLLIYITERRKENR